MPLPDKSQSQEKVLSTQDSIKVALNHVPSSPRPTPVMNRFLLPRSQCSLLLLAVGLTLGWGMAAGGSVAMAQSNSPAAPVISERPVVVAPNRPAEHPSPPPRPERPGSK